MAGAMRAVREGTDNGEEKRGQVPVQEPERVYFSPYRPLQTIIADFSTDFTGNC